MNKLAKKLLESNLTTAKGSPCDILEHKKEFSLSEEDHENEETN